ncbi:hypothetical protein D3C80_1728790 [compost metagenome]
MPSVPLSHSHGKSVHVLVQLIEHGNGLNNHIVSLVDIELDLGTRVGMGETQLSLLYITLLDSLDEFVNVESNASQQLKHGIICKACDILH